MDNKNDNFSYEKIIYSDNINLADASLGATVLNVSDDFFAPAIRLIDPNAPKFIPNLYDQNGKWMDGWETRRRRSSGHDYCVIKLAFPGLIETVLVDTTYFTGNSPMAISMDYIFLPGLENLENTNSWHQLLDYTLVASDSENLLRITKPQLATHVRFNIYPDGGVARLKVIGHVDIKCTTPSTNDFGEIDMISMENGGRVIACNDNHYGNPLNLIKPGAGTNMGDGWETRRRRYPGNDWCIFKMFAPCKISRIEVDTSFFKGNFPSECSIQALEYSDNANDDNLLIFQSIFWPEILQKVSIKADNIVNFSIIESDKSYSHVKLNIYPDGGVSRFRIWGYPS